MDVAGRSEERSEVRATIFIQQNSCIIQDIHPAACLVNLALTRRLHFCPERRKEVCCWEHFVDAFCGSVELY